VRALIGDALVRAALALLALVAFSQTAAAVCARQTHQNETYVVCEVDLERQRIGLHWLGPDREAFAGLQAVEQNLRRTGARPLMLMNAGMYHADLAPVGLYIENGRERVGVSTRDGPGNFHLKPNGVFFIAGSRAGVLETREFLRRKPQAELATQSGPMLVINGRMHPHFSPTSDSRKVRNGVGVRADGRVFFAISEQVVTFADFAGLFRDRLQTPNALFLDGSVSSLLAPGFSMTGFRSLGPILSVTER
jgi:uncharacterized protein YigE (DUF2233 family)